MTEFEIKQLQDYLNHKFKTDKFVAKKGNLLTTPVKYLLMMNLLVWFILKMMREKFLPISHDYSKRRLAR